MHKRQIGNTGVYVTPLGFGTSALGDMPDTYGYSVSEDAAQIALDAVFSSHVNIVDSSRNYGLGRSEERLGRAFRRHGGVPDGIVISTKLDRNMETNSFTASDARRSVEESLNALGVNKIDILHLHDPEHAHDLNEITSKGGALDELFKMRDEGIASCVGLAMGKIDLMMSILKDWDFDAMINHNRYTLLNRQADQMYTYAHERGIAIMNAAPFAGGILAKGSLKTQKLAYQDADAVTLEPVRQFEAACARHNVEPGAAALQFSVNDPRITSTLVGISRPESVARNLAWMNAHIPSAFWDEISEMPYSVDDPEANREYRPG
jgi:D-threo-aldose 1-dehydrogenase